MFTRESIDKELRRIQASIPESFRKAVVISTPISPTVEMIIDKAIEDPNFDPEKKRQLVILKEAGHFNKMAYGEDEAMAKKIDNFINREIKKSIKEGKLPTKKKLKELQNLWKEQENNTSKT